MFHVKHFIYRQIINWRVILTMREVEELCTWTKKELH